MAQKAKKDSGLTPEAKLAQALVSAEEQPYPVSLNWCWTTVGVIASVRGGKRIPKGKHLTETRTSHPYVRVTDFNNRSVIVEQVKYIDDDTFDLIHNYTISSNDIYISIAGTIGKVGIIPDFFDGANLTENAAKITNIKGIEQKYLLWLLESEFAQTQMKDSTISTTQPKLALFRIENIKIPLPPYGEQQRIVARIESLFAKLDEAKEKARAVVDSFETRKAAILHKAFTGKLTAKWRKEHGIGLNSWKRTTINDIFEVFSGKGFKEKEYSTDGIKLLRISNVTYNSLVWEDTKYLPKSYLLQEYALVLQPEDIVMALNRPITNGKLKVSIPFWFPLPK